MLNFQKKNQKNNRKTFDKKKFQKFLNNRKTFDKKKFQKIKKDVQSFHFNSFVFVLIILN